MENFELPRLFAERPAGHNYFELIRVPAMSAGLYVLQPGEADQQAPHKEDEIYYVVEHHFHSITTELQVLVIFAPAETPTTS